METNSKARPDWWKDAVIYQIYPRSFQDSNGDGLGDIPGIISRLDCLAELGVDAIWLSPVYDSPQVDNGYDIADYRAIWPPFGTMEDMDALIREARKRGISILMDLVLNHSSDRHPWFREALKGRDNPYHDYYIWAEGPEDSPPNDMRAAFGGSAWQWVPDLGQFYFHQFAVGQPDLNWDNPGVRQELYAMIRFWIDRGVDGFRLDVIDHIAKEPFRGITKNGPRLHEYLQEMYREAFREQRIVTVGEAWGADLEEALKYCRPDRPELSMIFQFDHICVDREEEGLWGSRPFSLPRLKRRVEHWQHGLYGRGWNSLFLNNHDLPRIVSRWGDDGLYRAQSAKMLATMLLGLQGTPFLYQGEELGMTNAPLALEEYRDVSAANQYKDLLSQGWREEDALAYLHAWSRDNARTPMQWSEGENAGFTTGTPWLPVNPNYPTVNVRAQREDPDSVWRHYQKLIALRRCCPVFREGTFTLLEPDSEQLFLYTRDTPRESLLVVCSFTGEEIPFRPPEGWERASLLLDSQSAPLPDVLGPWEARMYYLAKESA